MPSYTQITVSQLVRLIGTPDAPTIIDVRTADDAADDDRLLPCADRREAAKAPAWAADFAEQRVVVVCLKGGKLAEGTAAWLRQTGIGAETLEGGFQAWRDAAAPLVPTRLLPPRDAAGRTVWVTRARPKVDRIACPWLIRRFVDPKAVFLYVDAAEVDGVTERFGATPFDVEGAFWSHRGERCTFDVMVEEFGLAGEALNRLADVVRAADTATLDQVPQAAGLLAASLGLSRMFRDDLRQLDAGMVLYDAFFRWARDAVQETHNWPAVKPAEGR